MSSVPQASGDQLSAEEWLEILETCDGEVAARYGESLNGAVAEALPQAKRACEIEVGEPVAWLQYGEIPMNEITLIAGDAGSAKTGYALKLAAAKAAEGLSVLFVSEEDPPEVLVNRLEAVATGHRWDVGVVLQNVHILALTGLQLNDIRSQLHLLAEIERVGAALVILDPLFELAGVDEDSNVAQRPLIRFLRQLMVRTGSTVVVIHHFGKAGEGKRKIDRVRGASAWYGAARAVFALEARDDGIQVECLKMSRAVRPATYVLDLTVETDPENAGIWLSATLHSRSLQAADADLAEAWTLEQIGHEPGHTTTELRSLAVGSGISREDLAGALRRLQASGRITFDPGSKGAKHWRPPTLPDAPGNLGKVAESSLPTLPNLVPAGSRSPAGGCPAPSKGASTLAGPVGFDEDDNEPARGDAWEPEEPS